MEDEVVMEKHIQLQRLCHHRSPSMIASPISMCEIVQKGTIVKEREIYLSTMEKVYSDS